MNTNLTCGAALGFVKRACESFSRRAALVVLLLAPLAALHAADDPMLAALRAADDERVRATLAADRARLADIFADDLRYAHSTGTVDTKNTLIDTITKGRMKYESIRYGERSFEVLAPGIAMMIGRAHVKVIIADGPVDNRLSFLAIWQEENGKWRFRAWQSCKIPAQTSVATASKESKSKLLPTGWDPALAGDEVVKRLVNVSPGVKGAHDAEFVCVGNHAYIVAEVNDTESGESAHWPGVYCTLSIVNLKTLRLEKVIPLARGEQKFGNATLPVGACFVPRILQKDDSTLRCYFASEQPRKRQSQTWYRDLDLKTRAFEPTIHKVKMKTAAGTFDMQPQYFHADAAAQGFKKPAQDYGLYLFDSFKKIDEKTYLAINNWPGHQNALALLHDDLETVEVIGHYNEPQAAGLSESAVQRLPDGTWMAICRSEAMGGNYRFTTSTDGRTWTVGRELPVVPNGISSKPTFDKLGDLYYLGWQEASSIHGVPRSVFNIEVSRDGRQWERKYRFETRQSFQYPTFHEHDGDIWLSVTQGDGTGSHKERIMFGKLERVGEFEPQAGKARQPIAVPPLNGADAATAPKKSK